MSDDQIQDPEVRMDRAMLDRDPPAFSSAFFDKFRFVKTQKGVGAVVDKELEKDEYHEAEEVPLIQALRQEVEKRGILLGVEPPTAEEARVRAFIADTALEIGRVISTSGEWPTK